MKPSDVLRATYSELALLCFVAFLGYVSTLLYLKVEPHKSASNFFLRSTYSISARWPSIPVPFWQKYPLGPPSTIL